MQTCTKLEEKFLIHSDFDTSANRQDVSTTSRRNLCLLPHITSAFLDAVLQFCEDPELCSSIRSSCVSGSDNSAAPALGSQHSRKL